MSTSKRGNRVAMVVVGFVGRLFFGALVIRQKGIFGKPARKDLMHKQAFLNNVVFNISPLNSVSTVMSEEIQWSQPFGISSRGPITYMHENRIVVPILCFTRVSILYLHQSVRL